jgi:2-methylcitrate dehydratase PrpD
MEVGFKPHAACRYAHGPIDLAQHFYNQGVRLDDVEKINVRMCELSIRQASKPKAPNLNAAMGSTQFGVALALQTGLNGLREYWDGFNDQAIHKAAAERTTLICEPAYGVTGRQAAIELVLKDGRVLKHDQPEPKGEPTNPLTDAEMASKFEGLVNMVETAPGTGETLSAMLMKLEDQPSIVAIIDSLKAQSEVPVLRAA